MGVPAQVVFAISYFALPPEFTGIFEDSERVVKNWHLFFCVACGLWGGLIIGIATEYFTSNRYQPVQVGLQQEQEVCGQGLRTGTSLRAQLHGNIERPWQLVGRVPCGLRHPALEQHLHCVCTLRLWMCFWGLGIRHWPTSNTCAQDVADACRTGAATDIIFGLALGYKSAIIPCLIIAITIYVSFSLASMYGIACAALGMLTTMATGALPGQ